MNKYKVGDKFRYKDTGLVGRDYTYDIMKFLKYNCLIITNATSTLQGEYETNIPSKKDTNGYLDFYYFSEYELNTRFELVTPIDKLKKLIKSSKLWNIK